MRIQLNKTLTLVLFTVFVTITGCFLDSDSKRSRDYSISIEANKAIPIDRIEVMYSVGDDTTFISYDNESIGHTSIDSASDKHSVLFTLTGDKSDQTIIDYTWYSNGIAILSNRNEFVLAGNVRPQSAVIDSAMVDLLIMYHTNKMVQNENSSDPIHQQTVYTHNSALFSSLVASNLVGADSSEANNLYRAYKTHQINIYGLQTPPDTLRVLSQSRDSLDHYGYPFSELLGYLFPETETFDDLIAALPQTVNIPVNDTTTVIDLPMAALFSITGSISAHAEETEYITVVIIDTNSFDSVRLEATKGTLDYSTTWRKVAPQAYRVEVQFYSSDSIQTGVVSAQFDSTQLTVILPGVDAWNGKPTIALSALDTLSINDQFVFTVKGIDTLNGVIDSSQVKIGENNWITVTPSDTLFNAPATQIDSLWVYGRVIDSEGNVVVDSSLTTVVLDLPVLTVKVVDTLIDLSDSVRISWVGSDEFGSIINYSVRPLENATDMDWIDAGLEKGISFNHASSDGYIQYIVRATDDDSQMVYDTVSVHKIIDPPVATSVSISGSAEQNGSLVVSYFYSDLLGDAEGTSFFQWFRGNDTIAGAITNTYTPIYSDNGAVLSCIVTPVALTGYTKIGEGIMAQFANQVTGFTAPVVSNITIIGTATFESTLRVSYNYNDAEGDTEGASQFQWLRGGTLIAGANSVEYQVTESDVGESLSVQVQPVALTGDVLSGTPVESEGVLAEGTLPSPVIETLGGTFAEDQLVTIVTSVENGTIHYTIDGAKPTELSPTYTGSISVSSTVILYASVFKNGWNNSVASVETYIINGSTSPPIISEDNRENATAFDITAFAGEGLIYVTQSTGTPDEPDESSTVVNGPISVDRTMNYKFKVFRTGFRPSITVSRSYVVNGQADAPQVTPSRNEATGFLVTASGIGTIYYTTDGSDPTDASDVWVDRSVTITGTYNFRIYRNLYLPSDVVTETYTINGQLEAPSVSLSNGIYNSIQTITVSEPNGSEVFYTINGTEPTKSSTSIAGTITVDGSATYQFKAFKDNWVSSQLTIRTYAMEIEEPSVVPDANHATEIVVSAQKSVGTIYYTSGVTSTIPEPTSSIGTLYSGEIRVQSSVYYKFKEFRNDWRSSPTALRHYVINGTTSFASLSNDAEHASSISVTASGTGTIYYSTTTNGSEPPTPIISSSWVWSNRTITRVGTTRYKYLLRRSGYVDNIQSRTFTINGPAPYSNISVGGSAESSIVVTAAAPGSIIYFSSTTNGSEPGTPSTSSVWSNRTISGTGTHRYKFLIRRSGYTDNIVNRTYIINGSAPYSSITGSSSAASSLPVAVSASGSSVYFSFTTNGSEPGTPSTSSVWSDRTISGTGTHRYKFLIRRSGFTDNIVNRTYAINGSAPYSSITGSSSAASSLPVAVSASGSSVYFSFTTNGSEPGTPSTSSVWSDRTISGTGTHRYKFLIRRSGYTDNIVNRTYIINGSAPYSSITGSSSAASSLPVAVSASGSSIYFSFTTNGSEPGTPSTSSVWSDRTISGTGTHRYKFLIRRSGFTDNIVNRTYTINGSAPYSFLTSSATVASSIFVTATASGSTIYYSSTTNGAEPGTPVIMTSTRWSNRTVSGTATHRYKFLIRRSGYSDNIVSRTYTINGPAPYTSITGTRTVASSIFVSAIANGSSIYFSSTTNGAEPGTPVITTSTRWSNRTVLGTATHRYKFLIRRSGYSDNIVSRTYTINGPAPYTSITGTSTAASSIPVSVSATGSSIYFSATTNGSEPGTPSTSSPWINRTITSVGNHRYKFLIRRSGYADNIVSRTYTINGLAPYTSITGTSSAASSMTISASASGSSIYFSSTTNGSEPGTPSTSSSWSNRTISSVGTHRYKFLIRRTGFVDNIVNRTYTINGLAPYTNISGTSSAASSMTISASASGSSIYFSSTTNSSEPGTPSMSSPWSNRTISSVGTHRYKFLIRRTGYVDNIVNRTYTINGRLTTPSINITSGSRGHYEITITSGVSGSTIWYSAPGFGKRVYTGKFNVTCNGDCGSSNDVGRVEAYITKTNWVTSSESSLNLNL